MATFVELGGQLVNLDTIERASQTRDCGYPSIKLETVSRIMYISYRTKEQCDADYQKLRGRLLHGES